MEQVIVNALVIGLTYVLMASGLSLIFGILQVINFAHGQFYMIGACVFYWVNMKLGVPYALALVLTMTIGGILGCVVEWVFLKKLVKASVVASLGVVIGLMLALGGLMEILFGVDDVMVQSPVSGVVALGGFRIANERLLIGVVALFVLAVLYYWIRYTNEGMATRATSQDKRAAQLMGIDVGRTRLIVMGIGTALAAVAGALIAPLFFTNVYLGGTAMFKSLIIITLGGMGSLPGAVLGGLIIGLIESFGQTYLGNITEMLEFILVILVLLIKPNGLLGVPYEISD